MTHKMVLITLLMLLSLPLPNAAPGPTIESLNGTVVQITRVMQPTTQKPAEIVPDIVVTLAVIAVCALLGIGIAKFADVVYDRHIKMNSRKDVSDHTIKMLRARAAIMRMKADPKTPELKYAKNAAAVWMSKAAGKKEAVDTKNPNAVNEIGKTHVPGIMVNHLDIERGKAQDNVTPFVVSDQRKDSIMSLSNTQTPVENLEPTMTTENLEPTVKTEKLEPTMMTENLEPKIKTEKLEPTMKTEKGLPPVAVHDLSYLTTNYHYT